MLLTRLEPHEAIATWPAIERVLRPALTDRPVEDVREAIGSNDMAAFVAHGMAGFGIVVVRVADTLEGHRGLFIHYLAGRTPKGETLATMREAVRLLEMAAPNAGCTEMRLGGRKGFIRAFPDYELLSVTDGHVEMRKVL